MDSLNKDNLVDNRFIEDIINGMYDWVRVIDRDDNIIYMNKAMASGLSSGSVGKKCYQAIGKNQPCENCISRKAVFDGLPHQKEEVIGERIFSVMSSPIKDADGEIISVVEVLRDITQTKKLQKKILEQNKELQEDLSIARKLQCSLLPRELPEDKIKFSFVYKPCEALGGDFLDIFSIDRDHVGVYIADVSGHGVPASMLTVFLRSSLNKKLLSPSAALNELYKEFNLNGFDHNLYITVFYSVIDLKTNTIVYSNAGHNVPPFIFNKERFELLRVPGIPISNWVENPVYTDRSSRLTGGDRIFFCTDGIIELKNSDKEQFGEDRLLNILLADSSEPSGTLNSVFNAACSFAGISDFSKIPDDITMALLHIK